MDTSTSPKRQLRAAGWAALVVGLAFLPQPIFIFLLPAPDGAEFLPPDRVGALALRTTAQALTWAVFSTAMIVLVVATSRIEDHRRTADDALWPRVATVFGVIGGAAWFAESAFRLSPLSQPAAHLAAAPIPAAAQGAILYAVQDIPGFGWTALGFLGVSVWLIGIGTTRMLPLSRVLRVCAAAIGGVTIMLFFVLPALPVSAFAVYLVLIATGIELLVRARRGSVPRAAHHDRVSRSGAVG